MKRSPNPQQRKRLFDLLEKFYDACLHIGYVIGVFGILAFIYAAEYPIWFLILFIPVALVGGIPFGIPIGGIPAMLISLLCTFLIDWFYPEDKPVPAVKAAQSQKLNSGDITRGIGVFFGCLLAAIVIVAICER